MSSDHKKHKKKHKKDKKRHKHDDDQEGSVEPRMQYPTSDKDGKFVWAKKQARDGLDKLSEVEQEALAKMKEKEKKIELWKVQRRREERELEQAARADELDRARLEKESALFKEWQDHEGEFHLNQARMRSELRIKNNRANPIDLLAYYIHHANDTDSDIIGEPLSVIQNISIKDLEDLQADIKVYKDLDRDMNDMVFWTDLEVVCEAQLKKLKADLKVEKLNRSSINAAVGSDVSKIFKNKTAAQLAEVYKGIQKKLKAGGSIDVAYWEKVSDQAFVEVSKARLKEKHVKIMKTREFAKKTKAAAVGAEVSQLFPIVVKDSTAQSASSSTQPPAKKKKAASQDTKKATELLAIVRKDKEDKELMEQCMQEYEDMCYTPIRVESVDMDVIIWTDNRFNREISELRAEVVSKGASTTEKTVEMSRELLEEQAEALMGAPDEDEELFNADYDLGNTTYSWSDKFKPRKPRFYNRVHTGYEWNKYNQTHYDQDNPPPKIVQGYKFNIFYQDLMDSSSTPQYSLKVCKDDKEFCILKITAGPPYEDIAFKVLNKEWEYSNRYSFKSQFSQGIFQLWFQFKKYRYRR